MQLVMSSKLQPQPTNALKALSFTTEAVITPLKQNAKQRVPIMIYVVDINEIHKGPAKSYNIPYGKVPNWKMLPIVTIVLISRCERLYRYCIGCEIRLNAKPNTAAINAYPPRTKSAKRLCSFNGL